jgi:hypothetical protein
MSHNVYVSLIVVLLALAPHRFMVVHNDETTTTS